MVKVTRKRGVNALRIGIKVGTTVLGLYAGGFFLQELGNTLNCTYSPFYDGLSLIGWTVSDSVVPLTSGTCNASGYSMAGSSSTYNNLITGVNGAGILAVIGIVAIAMLVFEFVDIKI